MANSGILMKTRHDKSLQPIPVWNRDSLGSSRSRGLFYVAVPAWLSFSRQALST